ncbi:VCBS repeat-containing protein [Flavobacteriaceae bacterium]|nr:VCBS repeat-containing protein [Flavobacteriaceae bacterium]
MKKLALFLSFLFVLSCTKDPIIYTLTTSANPSDGGTVSPSTQQYDEGKTATITATASSEYLFQSWSGATGSTNSTSVVMNSDKSVTANFVKKKYALTTAVEGEGTVTEKVIKAGAATDYNSGTIVELTATPSGEWLFVEWKGDLTGSENPTQITIDKAKSVTAVFVKKQYPLTIEIEGEGTVSEKVIKVGLATDYNSGTIVELTAEPTGDWEFVGWTGDITSTENPVQITIDEAKIVKARFHKPIDYLVNSHYYKNEMNPYFDLIKITKNHGIEGPKYGGYDTGVAYADFNGDGYIDINLMLNAGVDGDFCEHFMLINNGDDTFTMNNDLITNTNFSTYMSRKTIVGDFNGDKIPDVVRIAGGHDWLRKSNIMLSDNGTFTFKEIDEVPLSQYHGFGSGDIDNDGDLDLFFGSPNSGFAINDGTGNFSWFRVDKKIFNFWADEVEHGPYGMQTVEILDFDNDGNLDILIGGSYADNSTDPQLHGPTILIGDGSGTFDYEKRVQIWGIGDKPYLDGVKVGNNDDFSFADIDGDGYKDVVLLYIYQIDDDPNNNGNTTMYFQYQIMKNIENISFVNVTDSWLPDSVKQCTCVWAIIKDIDNNGRIDLTEYSSKTSKGGSNPNITCSEDAWRWEWNGSKFEKIN